MSEKSLNTNINQMAANAINNFFGAHSASLGLGQFGSLGLAASTKPPQLERYHDEHGWQKSSPKGNKKGNVALSALTLLAFLFFLHILQNCIQEHMHEMKGEYDKGSTSQNITIPLIYNNFRSRENSREMPKGDEGILPNSEEDFNNKIQAQKRAFKTRGKKNPNQQKQQKQKQAGNKAQNKPRNGQSKPGPVPVKNTVPGVVRPVDVNVRLSPFGDNIPMHRIDNIP